VSHNDLDVGKRDRDVLQQHRVGVLQPHVTAATHARADARMTGVKDRRQMELIDDFVDRPRHAILRLEPLHRRVEVGRTAHHR